MKKTILFLLIILAYSCNEGEECNPNPILETKPATNITNSTATINGEIVPPECNSSFINQGFVYGKDVQPTTQNSTQVNSNGSVVSSDINSLSENTTYYFRTFYHDNEGVFYGNEQSFTTQVGLTVIETLAVSDITTSSAKLFARITRDGNSTITERGFVYSKTELPSISDNKVISNSGIGSYEAIIDNLEPNTEYYARSYSINEGGITYGNEITFKTLCLSPTGSLTYQINRANGEISILFNYDISIPTLNYIPTEIKLTLNNLNSNSLEEYDISLSETNGTLKLENLIPKTQYNDLRIIVSSSTCGQTIIEPAVTNFTLPSKYDVGDESEGGIVIFMYPNGINGIAVSKIDAGEGNWACDTTNSPEWQGYSTFGNNIDDWEGEIGDGDLNSQAILNFLNNSTGNSPTGYFANYCNCINNVKAVELATNFNHEGYSDWFLPHIKTLNLIYENYKSGLLSDFKVIENPCGTSSEPIYASSSGDGGNAGWINFNLTGNNAGRISKGSFGVIFRVRPVRKF